MRQNQVRCINNKIFSALKQSYIFADADNEKLSGLLPENLTVKDFERGDLIFPCGGEKALCIIVEGKAESYSGSTPLNFFGTGDIFGAASLFCADEYTTHISAKTKGKAVYFSEIEMKNMLAASPELALKYISFLSEKIYLLNRKIDAFTSDSAVSKTAKYLINSSEGLSEFDLPVSLSKLSSRLSAGRASLYRAFETIEELGAIKRDKGHIIITDKNKLIELAKG